MKELNPKTIREGLTEGNITSEDAALMFQEMHNGGEIVAYNQRGPNRFTALGRYVFDHQLTYQHYSDRKDLEEGVKHIIGTVALMFQEMHNSGEIVAYNQRGPNRFTALGRYVFDHQLTYLPKAVKRFG